MITTTNRPVRRIIPKPPPLLLAPHMRVRVVTIAQVREGRLRALVGRMDRRASINLDEGFRARVAGIAAKRGTLH
ncbi:MAG: hypothetical protein HZT43_01365 [Exiguobacterium profundum]|nr:MAG: hypothetical protein HZT43_01365 [Exiguobacterium profundum]